MAIRSLEPWTRTLISRIEMCSATKPVTKQTFPKGANLENKTSPPLTEVSRALRARHAERVSGCRKGGGVGGGCVATPKPPRENSETRSRSSAVTHRHKLRCRNKRGKPRMHGGGTPRVQWLSAPQLEVGVLFRSLGTTPISGKMLSE